MSQLSVVMIVKNEAHCLADCLESVRGIADEIVIGDTGSTDNTKAIAARHGARVIDVPWIDDFAAARNAVLEAARGDWLLHMDADELLDAEGAKHIRAIVDAGGGGADAVEVTLANYSDDPRAWRWCAVEPGDSMARGAAGYIAVPLLRLFRNHRGFQYREPVHENITETVLERNGVIRREPIVIHHYGYGSHSARSDEKGRRYLAIAQSKVAQRPEDPKAWHDYAEQALACGDAPEAERATREALKHDPRHLAAGTTLANILLNRGELDDARTILENFESAGMAAPHVLTALAAIDMRQGRVTEAIARLECALDQSPGNVMSALYYARALDLAGRAPESAACLDALAARVPALAEVRNRLDARQRRVEGEQALSGGDARGALEIFVVALRLDPEDPLIHRDIGRTLEVLGQHDAARKSFDRARRLAPGVTP